MSGPCYHPILIQSSPYLLWPKQFFSAKSGPTGPKTLTRARTWLGIDPDPDPARPESAQLHPAAFSTAAATYLHSLPRSASSPHELPSTIVAVVVVANSREAQIQCRAAASHPSANAAVQIHIPTFGSTTIVVIQRCQPLRFHPCSSVSPSSSFDLCRRPQISRRLSIHLKQIRTAAAVRRRSSPPSRPFSPSPFTHWPLLLCLFL